MSVIGRAVLLALVMACSDPPPPPAQLADSLPPAPPAPVGLFGTWVRTTPARAASDTLILRADSSGRGWISYGERRVAFTKWRIRYLSADAPESRADGGMKLQDGGDSDCTFGSAEGCRSGPVLCVDDVDGPACFVFAYRHDSLRINANTWYRRVQPTA